MDAGASTGLKQTASTLFSTLSNVTSHLVETANQRLTLCKFNTKFEWITILVIIYSALTYYSCCSNMVEILMLGRKRRILSHWKCLYCFLIFLRTKIFCNVEMPVTQTTEVKSSQTSTVFHTFADAGMKLNRRRTVGAYTARAAVACYSMGSRETSVRRFRRVKNRQQNPWSSSLLWMHWKIKTMAYVRLVEKNNSHCQPLQIMSNISVSCGALTDFRWEKCR